MRSLQHATASQRTPSGGASALQRGWSRRGGTRRWLAVSGCTRSYTLQRRAKRAMRRARVAVDTGCSRSLVCSLAASRRLQMGERTSTRGGPEPRWQQAQVVATQRQRRRRKARRPPSPPSAVVVVVERGNVRDGGAERDDTTHNAPSLSPPATKRGKVEEKRRAICCEACRHGSHGHPHRPTRRTLSLGNPKHRGVDSTTAAPHARCRPAPAGSCLLRRRRGPPRRPPRLLRRLRRRAAARA